MRVIVILAIVLAASMAHAYPQFQLSSGDDRCGQCHLSGAGGGLISDYGRDEAGATISRGGDGRLLHGLWTPPDWLALGGDLRFAAAEKALAGTTDTLVFPMQLDAYVRIAVGKFAASVTAGVRGGGARDEPRPPLVERLVSREHYIAYAGDTYATRVGRFFPVFGLRIPDHTAFIRRYMGFYLLEEPYAVEVSREGDADELHVTAFIPNPVPYQGSGQQGYGATIAYERRFSATLLGAQARASLSTLESHYTLGGTAKHWMPEAKLLWLAELDVQREVFSRGAPGRTQVAGYLGLSRWLAKGVLLGGALHVWDPDLNLNRNSREAAELTLQYFPRAHFELNLLVRGALEGTNADEPGFLSLLQLHYYL